MARKRAVHYNKTTEPRVTEPACGAANSNSEFTTDKRKVTCELCKNSLAWKGRGKGRGK